MKLKREEHNQQWMETQKLRDTSPAITQNMKSETAHPAAPSDSELSSGSEEVEEEDEENETMEYDSDTNEEDPKDKLHIAYGTKHVHHPTVQSDVSAHQELAKSEGRMELTKDLAVQYRQEFRPMINIGANDLLLVYIRIPSNEGEVKINAVVESNSLLFEISWPEVTFNDLTKFNEIPGWHVDPRVENELKIKPNLRPRMEFAVQLPKPYVVRDAKKFTIVPFTGAYIPNKGLITELE